MKKELTFFELIRLFLAILLAIIVFISTDVIGRSFLPDEPAFLRFASFLLFIVFLPPFLAILIACLVPSWRYRTIAATMMLMAITVWLVLDLLLSFSDVSNLLVSLIRLSISLSGALAATLIWQRLKQQFFARARPITVASQPGQKMPKTSAFLMGLAFISIPATYITIFVSAFLVVGYSALLMLSLLELPRVPIILIIAALLAPLVAIWAALRAIGAILRPRAPFQPAHQLDMTTHPQTKRMIEDICAAVKTRRPEHVLLHAEPTFFVTQQKMQTFDGVIQGRTLALGMPLLPHLTNQEFKAILAHEFAHFSGRDTLYSVWVAQVYRGLGESIRRLQGSMTKSSGTLGLVMNLLLLPSLLFLGIFYEFFASIDAIISRTRELRADWIAATNCGSDVFIAALQKVVQYSSHFSEHQQELSIQKSTEIFQEHRLLARRDEDELHLYLDKAMDAVEQEFASHPTLRTRISSVPVHLLAPVESEDTFQAELVTDEEKLSTSVSDMMRRLQELYTLYTQVKS